MRPVKNVFYQHRSQSVLSFLKIVSIDIIIYMCSNEEFPIFSIFYIYVKKVQISLKICVKMKSNGGNEGLLRGVRL